MACWGLGWLHNVRGEIHAAIELLERALAVATKWEHVVWLPNGWEQLGYAYARAHRISEGIDLLERAVKTYESVGRRPLTMHLGEVYVMAGRLEDANAHAEHVLARARPGGERRMEALALHVLAEIAARRGPSHVDESRDRYRHALGLAEELGMRPLLARCLVGLGTLNFRASQRVEALSQLATAAAMCHDMGMTCIVDDDVRQLTVRVNSA